MKYQLKTKLRKILSEAETTLVQEDEQSASGNSSIEFHRGTEEVPLPRRSERYTKLYPGPDGEMWIAAIKQDELTSQKENHTCDLVKLPAGRKTIGYKWIFKRKLDEQGYIVWNKARLVAQGFIQKIRIDYDEVSAPIIKPVTFKILATVAAQRKLLLKHTDVSFNRQERSLPPSRESLWFETSCSSLEHHFWCCVEEDEIHAIEERFLPLLPWHRREYRLFGCLRWWHRCGLSNCGGVFQYYQRIEQIFCCNIRYFLGVGVKRTDDRISLNQAGYVKKLLSRFGMQEAKPSKIPLDRFVQGRDEWVATNQQAVWQPSWWFALPFCKYPTRHSC